jgi:hypothetical protein
MMAKQFRGNMLCLIAATSLLIGFSQSVFATTATSVNYSLRSDVVNAGIDTTTSANYQARSSVGDTVSTLNTASTNAELKSGFQPGVSLIFQAINFAPLTQRQVGDMPFVVAATGGASGLAVTFASTTPTICTTTGINGATVSILTVGTCTIRASQAGDATHTAAVSVEQSFAVAQGSQTIGFNPTQFVLANALPFTVTATGGGSTNPVMFISTTPLTCAAGGVNGASITLTGNIGLCTLQANQAGNVNYTQAAPVSRSINVINPQSSTHISLSANNNATTFSYGDAITLTANLIGTNPTGVINFSFTSATLVPAFCQNIPINNGVAQCILPRVVRPAGLNEYAAQYAGDSRNSAANASIRITITKANIALSLSASPVKPVAGQTVVLRALVGADDPSGQINFSVDGISIVGCAQVLVTPLPSAGEPDAGVATCTLQMLQAGSQNIIATYIPNNNNLAAQATLTLVTIANGPTTDYSDMWWAGISENGWGLSIAQKGNIQFNAFYVYDAAGKPVWTVMPGGQWNTTGVPYTEYRGALYQPTSSPFNAYDVSQFRPATSVGNASLTYLDANNAIFRYTINGISAEKRIMRQPFGDLSPSENLAKLQVNDLWWAGLGENGWGINIAQQNRTLFMVWYTYGQDGKTTWLTVPGGTWNGTIFTGDIYTTTSSAWLGVSYDVSQFRTTKVGTMTIDFEDANRATMIYTVNGVTQTKRITRQPF